MRFKCLPTYLVDLVIYACTVDRIRLKIFFSGNRTFFLYKQVLKNQLYSIDWRVKVTNMKNKYTPVFFLSKNLITIVFSNHSIYQMQLSSLHYKQTNKISVISTKFSNIQLKHNCKQMVFQYKYEVEYQQNASQMPNKCRIRKSQNQLSHWRWTEQLVIVYSRPFDVQVCVRSDASLIDRI